MQKTIVIGLGAMGSATAQHLAQRGQSVVCFDRFTPPHKYGSSHGRSRIIRQAYYEDPRYIPLLLRAYELWRELEGKSGTALLHLTGGLAIGRASGKLVGGAAASARTFSLPHEVLGASELRRRHPAFSVSDDMLAVWEPSAGYLDAEGCLQQQLEQASRAGAELHTDEEVVDWTALPQGGVSVRTSRQTHYADRLVITAGPWAPQLLANLHLPLRVTRQVLLWFQPRGRADLFRTERLPVYLVESEAGQPVLYGFPFTGPDSEGVKVALHGSEEVCTADTVVREIRDTDECIVRERLAEILPLLAGPLLRAETCLYTMTPDENFIVDKHPVFSQVTLAGGFSGHGFKFANVIGEIVADLTMDLAPAYCLDFLSIGRFHSSGPSRPLMRDGLS